MIEYVIAHNIDNRIFSRIKNEIENDQIVCLPTDTNWALVCKPDSKKAIQKIQTIMGQDNNHHFSILCSDIKMASSIAKVEDYAFRLLKKLTPGLYTFIFKAQSAIQKKLPGTKTDHQIGVRIPKSVLVQNLIIQLNHPLIASSFKSRHFNDSQDIFSYMIEEKYGHEISIIVDPGETEFLGTSSIINFTNPDVPIEILRIGDGDVSFLT